MAQGQTAVKERQDLEIKKPKRYQVLLHNDDVTPMEFVVDILYTCSNMTTS